jgi:hypothetical protein
MKLVAVDRGRQLPLVAGGGVPGRGLSREGASRNEKDGEAEDGKN